jgi:GntR family transcriptional regulator
MYYQIEEQLRSLILSGTLQEEQPLPSIRELAAQLACSVITIRRVYQDLENEGFLRTRQGMGTFVAKVDVRHHEQYRHDAAYEAFRAAVETARRVHCSDEEMRRILEHILQEEEKSGGGGQDG